MVKTFILDLGRWLESDKWRIFLPALPEERRRYALSMTDPADSARIAGAGWLLQYALQQVGLDGTQFTCQKNKWGKPFFTDPDAPQFSISHSGHLAVCAVGREPLGIDVETARCNMRIAHRFFHQDETAYLSSLPSAAQTEALGRLWAAKEAAAKAFGMGLFLPLQDFCVVLSDRSAILRQAVSQLPYLLNEYRYGDYYICLCCAEDCEKPQIVSICGGV